MPALTVWFAPPLKNTLTISSDISANHAMTLAGSTA
jgi:hypothetical protein